MIKTDRQFAIARRTIQEFEDSRNKQSAEPTPKDVDPRMRAAALAAKSRMIVRLRAEMAEYEALKSGDTRIIRAASLSTLPRALIQTRIARKLTQKALAEKLGVKEQQIQRWEQRDYENVSYECLLNVAEALEFDVDLIIRKRAPARAQLSIKPRKLVAPHGYAGNAGLPAWPPPWGQIGYDPGRLLQILQKATTFNQTIITQYSYIGSEKHKKLRIARDKGRQTPELLQHFQDLYTYLRKDFELAVSHNATFLRSSFDDRGEMPPRICLKSNMIGGGGEKQILPLFRDTRVTYDSSVDVKGNTGFSEIARTGVFYVENDIPSAVLRGEYVNPRLNTDAIRARYPEATPEATEEVKRDWKRYWTDAETEKNDAAFYKSTLIMPLKLWDNEISADFKGFLEGLQVNTRIFGYLCLDHTDTDYFTPAVDLNMAKICADALCTLLLLRMKWTTYSSNTKAVSSIKEVEDWLRSQDGRVPTLEPDVMPPSPSPLPSIHSEGEPRLMSADLRRSLVDA